MTPSTIAPMKAVAGLLPPDDGRWAYEIKWDGMRVVAEIDEDGLRLRSPRGADVMATFPELAGLADATGGRPATIDGEVVALDPDGRPSFALLAERMHVSDPTVALARAATVPVTFLAFDLLSFDGHEAWRLPYLERRRLLEEVVEPGDHWQVPAHRIGGGPELLAAAAERGLEGVVAKRIDAAYEPGRRSHTWRKIKVRHRQEFVVGGWTDGTGARATKLGALMLGCHRAGRLCWTGNVGTGFRDAELTRLANLLAPLGRDTAPFDPAPTGVAARHAHWVEPELVVEVEFAEWTPEGRLRHPAYLGQRTDKASSDVTCDP